MHPVLLLDGYCKESETRGKILSNVISTGAVAAAVAKPFNKAPIQSGHTYCTEYTTQHRPESFEAKNIGKYYLHSAGFPKPAVRMEAPARLWGRNKT